MKIQIKHRWNLGVLFECEADSMRIAVEMAIKAKANLSEANLSKADLSWANLSWANLSKANLSEANLSEAKVYGENITKPPVQISGFGWWINITEKHVQIGCKVYKAEEWFKFSDKEISSMHGDALVWWKKHRDIIKAVWEFHAGNGAE